MPQINTLLSKVQRKLDDEDGVVWTYDELLRYAQDGYDELCRRSKCLFDMHVIDNVPQVGNWGSDLDKYTAENTPGMGVTDTRLNTSAQHERDAFVGAIGQSFEGPTPATSPGAAAHLADFGISSKVSEGRLPEETVDVYRVTWDELELPPEDSAWMRRMDTQYEVREGGDPRHYTMDKDGLLIIRLVPPARGDASYNDVDGSWGTMTQTDDTAIETHGTWGILVEAEGAFPAGGPWGTPTRQHPTAKNIVVELARLGRPLTQYDLEVPRSYWKYVGFWVMHRALRREGPGQDLKLSKHYFDRFEMGVARMRIRLRNVSKEQVLKMSSIGESNEPFGIGDPQLPYPYGPSTGRTR